MFCSPQVKRLHFDSAASRKVTMKKKKKKEQVILVKNSKKRESAEMCIMHQIRPWNSDWPLSHWLAENHTCSQFLRMQIELFCENSQLTCLLPSFSQRHLKMCLTAELPIAGKLSGEAFKVVDNFSHVSIDHMNKESLDSTYDCQA